MKNKIVHRRQSPLVPLAALAILLHIISLSFIAKSQTSAYDGERAVCKVTANGKNYQPQLNPLGYFMRVYGLPIDALISVEVFYPQGNKGDEVVLAVEDGGKFDNDKAIKVVQLDNQKKLAFGFQFIPDNPGIYRITLQKGSDTKVVQLWASN